MILNSWNSERTILYSLWVSQMHLHNCKQLPFLFLCVLWGICPSRRRTLEHHHAEGAPQFYTICSHVPMKIFCHSKEALKWNESLFLWGERRFPYFLFILLRLGNTLGLIMPWGAPPSEEQTRPGTSSTTWFKHKSWVSKFLQMFSKPKLVIMHNLNLDSGGG